MMAAFPEIDEHDSLGAIGPSWRGRKRFQVAQASKLEHETMNKIFRSATKSLLRGQTVNGDPMARDVRGPQSNWEIPD